MSDEDESAVRAAYEAYGQGEVNRLLELVHPDLEWTYLDPSMENPQPQTCHGREQLARMLGQQADRGFVSQVEEIASSGDKVMVAVRTPGADQRRAWQSGDRSYLVLTMDCGRIVALRDFRERDEARGFAGLGQGKR
jgi:ketosteroid isomerase-like protein